MDREPESNSRGTSKQRLKTQKHFAEREGFEPSRGITLYLLSKEAQSTTLTPLLILSEQRHLSIFGEKTELKRK